MHSTYIFHPLTPPNRFSISFMLYCVLECIHSSFQSDFITECNLVFPLSISSILSFPYDHPVAAYVSFLIFPSLLSFFLAFFFLLYLSFYLDVTVLSLNMEAVCSFETFMSTSEPTMCQNPEDSPLFLSVNSSFLYVFETH